jgi:hypothetical protein
VGGFPASTAHGAETLSGKASLRGGASGGVAAVIRRGFGVVGVATRFPCLAMRNYAHAGAPRATAAPPSPRLESAATR